MPRTKSAPQKRTVHRFYELSADSQPAQPLDSPDEGNNGYDENYCDEGFDETTIIDPRNDGDHLRGRTLQDVSFGNWKIEPNDIDNKSCFLLTAGNNAPEQVSTRVLMFDFKIGVHMYSSALEDLGKIQQLGLFCQGQHLVIESTAGPSLDGFSCNALFPVSLLRVLKKDICSGALHLNIKNVDATGFTITASTILYPSQFTYLSSTVLQWLLSLLAPTTTSQPSSSSSSSYCPTSDMGLSPAPSWSISCADDFDSETFLRAATASSSSRQLQSASSTSSSSEFKCLAKELRIGGLTTELRPYQLQGVEWLFRRLSSSVSASSDPAVEEDVEDLHTVVAAGGRWDGWVLIRINQSTGCNGGGEGGDEREEGGLWYNLMTEQITNLLPPIAEPIVRAAVLADEMGIGKSIQVLSLVLLLKLRRERDREAQAPKGNLKSSEVHSAEDFGSAGVESVDEGLVAEARQDVEEVNSVMAVGAHGALERKIKSDHLSAESVPEIRDGVQPCGAPPTKARRRKVSLTADTIHKAMAAEKRKRVNMSEYPCLCGRRSEKKADLGWVECGGCMRWLHVRCCGFNSGAEASRELGFECLACSCVRYGGARKGEGAGSEDGCEVDGKIRSDTTLVLMPSTLITQWKGEVQKHFAGSLSSRLSDNPRVPGSAEDGQGQGQARGESPGSALRVFVYEGCDELTLRRAGLTFRDVDPRTLAIQYDVIFMSLKALTKDFHQAQVTGGAERTLRAKRGRGDESDASGADLESKMYVSFPPPYMCVRFGMVVVDETQKIESEGVSQGLSLCTRIAAARRLCVTGTPLGHDRLSDLHSLCQFLHVQPYGQQGKREWGSVFGDRSLLRDQRMQHRWLSCIFGSLMLRRTKDMLGGQLGLQDTVTSIKLLSFSGFETALYAEKLQSIARDVAALRGDSDISDAKSKLEVLRKGCCHPQVWDRDLAKRKGGGQGGGAQSQVARPFEEIMILKVEQSRVACEEKQRELVYHLNSLAGVAVLQAQQLYMHWKGVQAWAGPAMRCVGGLTAVDYLRRALRAFCYAYSCLERNRQTCPVLGLVRVGGSPEGAYRVLRTRSEGEGEGEQIVEDGRWKSLTNSELRADRLCFSWTGLSGSPVRACRGEVMVVEDGEACPLTTPSVPDLDISLPVSATVPRPVQASKLFSPHTSQVSAKMAFSVGRRLQQLRVRSDLASVIAEMRCRVGWDRGGDGRAGTVLVFPCEMTLLAATGMADAFTRVSKCNLPLPSIVPSSASASLFASPSAGQKNEPPPSFPLDNGTTLSAQSVEDFPLTFRARSWRMDVESVHGYCLNIQMQRQNKTEQQVGIVGGSADPHSLHVTGQWRRTADYLASSFSSSHVAAAEPSPPPPALLCLCMEVELFEATFDVDLFQELHICANIPLVASMLEQQGESPAKVALQLEDYVGGAGQGLQDLVNPTPVSPTPSSVTASSAPAAAPTHCFDTADASAVDVEVEVDAGDVTPAVVQSPSSSRTAPLLLTSPFGSHSGDKTETHTGAQQPPGSIPALLSIPSISDSKLLQAIIHREKQIEKDHVSGAQAVRVSALLKMEETVQASDRLEQELLQTLDPSSSSSSSHRKWWVPLLLHMEREKHLSSLLGLQSSLEQGQDAYSRFKRFSDVRGLAMLLGLEFEEMQSARTKAIAGLRRLSLMPSSSEILLASDCQRCRVYFNKKGPVCAHCRLEDVILAYRLKLVAFKSKRKIIVSLAGTAAASTSTQGQRSGAKAGHKKDKDKDKERFSVGRKLGTGSGVEEEVQAQEFNSEQVEGAFSMVVKHIRAYAVRYAVSASREGREREEGELDLCVLRDAAVAECRRCECLWKEVLAMTGLWQRYMALLKVHDEVEQSRQRIGIAYSPEEGGGDAMQDNNLFPFELPGRYEEGLAQVAGRELALKESVGQLAFYKNQEKEARMRLLSVKKQRLQRMKSLELGTGTADRHELALPSITVNSEVSRFDVADDGAEDELACVFCREDLYAFPSPPDSTAAGPSSLHGAHTAPGPGPDPAPSDEPVVCLPCAHSFHKVCVRRWLQLHKACPVCKRAAALSSCVAVDTGITDIRSSSSRGIREGNLSDSGLTQTQTLRLQGSDSLAQGAVHSAKEEEEEEEEEDIEIKGQWGSKIDALVADLLRLLRIGGDSGDGEKAVVFSQWAEMIEIVGEALEANNILYSLCLNRAKDFKDCGSLERFKSSIDTRVLLMPLHLGAEGLDLVQASHVFLLEPLLNPALESQAVNRIHRIGQLRATHVHKYAVKGTVEELILRGQQLKVLALSLDELEEGTLGVQGSPIRGSRRKSKLSGQKDQEFLSLRNIRYLLAIPESAN